MSSKNKKRKLSNESLAKITGGGDGSNALCANLGPVEYTKYKEKDIQVIGSQIEHLVSKTAYGSGQFGKWASDYLNNTSNGETPDARAANLMKYYNSEIARLQ